ncbi:MAG TPA: hypothetical protein VMM59_07035 [Thermohalobaculum sp.]|nr:hypothetical protein [Thermohalobaculum sp.]
MSRGLGRLQMVTGFVALGVTPLLMLAGYNVFGLYAASNIGLQGYPADYLQGVIAALLLLVLIVFWPVSAGHRQVLALLWLVRTGMTLGVMIAYEAFYPGDMIRYYHEGLSLSHPLGFFEFGDGTRNMAALYGVMSEASTSYNAIKVMFSYIGLIAVYVLYRATTICLGHDRLALLYILGLFPSLLLWSSFPGKDPVVLLGIALFSYGAAGIIVRQRWSMLIWVVLGLALAASIRIWLGIIFVTPLIFTYVIASRTPVTAKVAFLIVAAPGLLLALQGFVGQFRIESAEDLVQTTDALSSAWAHGGSAQQIQGGFESLAAMLAFMPIGAFSALFRPLPFEVTSPFAVIAGFENALILLLLLRGLVRRGFGWLRQPVLLWAAATLVAWAAVYGFVAYQNLGTAFRWRSQVTPILLLLILYLNYAHHLKDEVHARLRRRPVQAGAASGAGPAPPAPEGGPA